MTEPSTRRATVLPPPPVASCFCLHGRLAGFDRVFPLADGETLVGRAPTSGVVLPVRGVSRRHAAVRLAAGEVSVSDLGSKNGVRVNGRPVEASPLALGDEVAFGPVTLRLGEIDAGDAQIGIAFAPATRGQGAAAVAATSRLAGGEAPALAWVRLLDEVVARLRLPPGDPLGALAAVVRRLALDGAAVVDWPAAGEPVVEIAVGRLGDLPPAAADDPPRARWLAAADGTRLAVWSEGRRDGAAAGIVLWGDFPGRRQAEPLLAALGRLLAGARGEALSDLPPGGRDLPAGRLVFPPGYVVGESPAMRALYRTLEAIVDADLPVLVCGETGVGKEPIARLLHASSERRKGPFVAVNCAAIPAELLEAEMFGIGRNVATGVGERKGRFAEASGGTLFLDEIGDMPLPLQAKLLRVLQEKEVQPVGAPAVPVDVRVVAATNADLRARSADGGFRRDLFYRIAGFVVDVPPLRRRSEDLPQLVAGFLRRASRETGRAVRGVTVKALGHLAAYPWPGNVRELEHEVRRLAALCPDGGVIDSLMLADHVLAPPAAVALPAADPPSLDLRAHTEAVERRLLALALSRAGGNRSRAAKLLGLSRNGLANRLRRHGIGEAP